MCETGSIRHMSVHNRQTDVYLCEMAGGSGGLYGGRLGSLKYCTSLCM